MTHKTWAPFAILGILIIIAGVFFVVKGDGDLKKGVSGGGVNAQVEKREPVSEEGYQYEVRNAVDAFRANQDLGSLKNSLLETRVPKEYLDFHLSLVGILDKSQSSEIALTQINQLAQTASWLQ